MDDIYNSSAALPIGFSVEELASLALDADVFALFAARYRGARVGGDNEGWGLSYDRMVDKLGGCTICGPVDTTSTHTCPFGGKVCAAFGTEAKPMMHINSLSAVVAGEAMAGGQVRLEQASPDNVIHYGVMPRLDSIGFGPDGGLPGVTVFRHRSSSSLGVGVGPVFASPTATSQPPPPPRQPPSSSILSPVSSSSCSSSQSGGISPALSPPPPPPRQQQLQQQPAFSSAITSPPSGGFSPQQRQELGQLVEEIIQRRQQQLSVSVPSPLQPVASSPHAALPQPAATSSPQQQQQLPLPLQRQWQQLQQQQLQQSAPAAQQRGGQGQGGDHLQLSQAGLDALQLLMQLQAFRQQ